MRFVAWSVGATGIAVALFLASASASSDARLRLAGAAGGLLVAVAGVLLGIVRCAKSEDQSDLSQGLRPRFFLERRRTPRHDVRIPVRFAVDGRHLPATLVSVSASGALLRLATAPGEKLHARVGDPVQIEDYPAGTLARVGTHGVYVDFAVRFEAAPLGASAGEVVAAASGPLLRD